MTPYFCQIHGPVGYLHDVEACKDSRTPKADIQFLNE